jgi:SpoIIAA-like
MIEHTFDPATAILHIQPKSSLEQADFEQLAKTVDPYIAGTGDLAGIIVETPGFPGWSSFGAMAAHLRFVKDHHKHVRKIALVTDSALGSIAEQLGAHFVSAEIKRFPSSELEAAKQWIAAHG